MIPLRDEDLPRVVPWATALIIAACAAVFAYQLTLTGAPAQTFVDTWALHPDRLGPERLYTVLTSVFIHAGWGHLLSNLLFLWVFGPGVEERSGGGRFLALYALFAATGTVAHLAASPGSTAPLVGASGAISGVLGAALALRPRARLRVAVLAVVVPVGVTSLPVAFLLGLWLLAQVAALLSATPAQTATVAWSAHLAGFAAGLAAGALIRTAEARGRTRFRTAD